MATMVHEAACLDALEGGQREILATLTDVTASLKRISLRNAEVLGDWSGG